MFRIHYSVNIIIIITRRYIYVNTFKNTNVSIQTLSDYGEFRKINDTTSLSSNIEHSPHDVDDVYSKRRGGLRLGVGL